MGREISVKGRRTTLPYRLLTPIVASILAGLVLGALWVRPVVKYTLYTFPPRISVEPLGTTSFLIGVKNTGGTDSFLWIRVTAENAEVVSENNPGVERADSGVRTMAVAEKQTDDLYRLIRVKIRLRDRPSWFMISVQAEKRINWSPSGIIALFGDIKRVPPTSATYIIKDTNDGVSTYVLATLT